MFEQTFVNERSGGRSSYSMAVSSIAQILVIGVLSAIPFVFTGGLPLARLRSVLAAPAPPRSVRVVPVSDDAHSLRKVFSLNSLRIVNGPLRPRTSAAQIAVDAPVGINLGDAGGVPFGDPLGNTELLVNAPTPPVLVEKHEVSGPVRIGGGVIGANLIYKVQPVYPLMAKASRPQGVVEFTATISKDGLIENLQLKRGHPLLVNAARDAVLQWRYRPTLLNGKPVEVVTDIFVSFVLSE